MTWVTLVPLIAQYGLPYVEKLWALWTSGSNPTQADFDTLRGLANQTAQDRMKANLVSAGVPLTDPKAITLISLAS